MSHHRGDYEDRAGTLRNGVTDDMVDARAAEIMDSNGELWSAAGEDDNIAHALCRVGMLALDRLSWPRIELSACGLVAYSCTTPPPVFLTATTALRAAISDYARRKLIEREKSA